MSPVKTLDELRKMEPSIPSGLFVRNMVDMPAELEFVSAVYFIWHQDELVYVGQSANLAARLYSYVRLLEMGRQFKWDLANWIECKREELDHLEAKYIYAYIPKYNAGLNLMALRNQKKREVLRLAVCS